MWLKINDTKNIHLFRATKEVVGQENAVCPVKAKSNVIIDSYSIVSIYRLVKIQHFIPNFFCL